MNTPRSCGVLAGSGPSCGLHWRAWRARARAACWKSDRDPGPAHCKRGEALPPLHHRDAVRNSDALRSPAGSGSIEQHVEQGRSSERAGQAARLCQAGVAAMRDQFASVTQPLMVMALAAAVGKLYSAFWRVAAEVREVSEYGDLGAHVISNSAPVVVTFEQIVSAEEAAHIISLARPRIQPGHVTEQPAWFVPSGVVRKARTVGRTNSVAWLGHNETPVVRRVVDRISDVVGISSTHAEAVHVIQYTDGQECEAFETHPLD